MTSTTALTPEYLAERYIASPASSWFYEDATLLAEQLEERVKDIEAVSKTFNRIINRADGIQSLMNPGTVSLVIERVEVIFPQMKELKQDMQRLAGNQDEIAAWLAPYLDANGKIEHYVTNTGDETNAASDKNRRFFMKFAAAVHKKSDVAGTALKTNIATLDAVMYDIEDTYKKAALLYRPRPWMKLKKGGKGNEP